MDACTRLRPDADLLTSTATVYTGALEELAAVLCLFELFFGILIIIPINVDFFMYYICHRAAGESHLQKNKKKTVQLVFIQGSVGQFVTPDR